MNEKENEAQVLIRENFFQHIVRELKPKQNVIETRAIFRSQINELINILQNKIKPKYSRRRVQVNSRRRVQVGS